MILTYKFFTPKKNTKWLKTRRITWCDLVFRITYRILDLFFDQYVLVNILIRDSVLFGIFQLIPFWLHILTPVFRQAKPIETTHGNSEIATVRVSREPRMRYWFPFGGLSNCDFRRMWHLSEHIHVKAYAWYPKNFLVEIRAWSWATFWLKKVRKVLLIFWTVETFWKTFIFAENRRISSVFSEMLLLLLPKSFSGYTIEYQKQQWSILQTIHSSPLSITFGEKNSHHQNSDINWFSRNFLYMMKTVFQVSVLRQMLRPMHFWNWFNSF